MAVSLFYDPDRVGQLAACGITGRQRSSSGAPATGFVVEGRRLPSRARDAVTNVIAVRGHVTITGPRAQGRAALPALPAPSARSEAQTAIELAEECARLRAEVDRLRRDNQRLSDDVARLITAPGSTRSRESIDLDDSSRRFSLLELDL